MLKIKLLLLFLSCSFILNGQEIKFDTAFVPNDLNAEELALFAGYNFNSNFNNKNFHIVEFGIKRTYNIGIFEPFCNSIYFSNEFIYTNNIFIIGPKIGAYISIMMITLGLESIYYTNFTGESIRLSPYIGFGSSTGRLTVNFPINLYKKDFDFINPITLHFSFQYAILWKKTWKQVFKDYN